MNINDIIETGDISAIREYMNLHGLVLVGNQLVPKDDETKTKLMQQSAFWNQRQQARKILLNSLN